MKKRFKSWPITVVWLCLSYPLPITTATTFVTQDFESETTASLQSKGWDIGIPAKNSFATEVGTEFVVAPPWSTDNLSAGYIKPPGGDFLDANRNIYVFPPMFDGKASGPAVNSTGSLLGPGRYLISDTDSATGSDNIGSKAEFWATTPSFSTLGAREVWWHADAEIENNNDGEGVVILECTVDNGKNWMPIWQTAEPRRPIQAYSLASSQPGFEGSSITGGYPIFGSASRSKSWDGIHGRWHARLPNAAANQPNVKVRIKYYEPSDSWWIALDNIVLDDTPPPEGNTVVFAETFNNGIPASWKNYASGVNPNKWSDGPLRNPNTGVLFRKCISLDGNLVPISIDYVREAISQQVARQALGDPIPLASLLNPTVANLTTYSYLRYFHPFGCIDGRYFFMLAGGKYAMWENGDDIYEFATLDTPAINLGTATAAWLDFDSEVLHGDVSAHYAVELSLNNGTTFARIFDYDTALSERDEAAYFTHHHIPIPQAAGRNQVVIRFRSAGGDPPQYEGFWVIDNVRVTANGIASTALAGTDIGIAPAGLTQNLGNGSYKLSGSGTGPFDTTGDQIHFAYERVSGDFDKRVRVKAISAAASDWNRGGLLARETLNPLSPVVMLDVAGLSSQLDGTGNPKGANRIELWVRPDESAPLTTVGRTYGGVSGILPNQWIRLQRVGNSFSGFVSTDGANWRRIAEHYSANLPPALYVGLFAGSASANGTTSTTVDFEAYGNTPLADTAGPRLLSAGTLDKNVVGVKFSEPLASASVTSNKFSISNGTVTGATLGVTGDSVYLAVSGLTADTFTVTVTGVTDTAGNFVAPTGGGSSATIAGTAAVGWTATDIGSFAKKDPTLHTPGDDPFGSGRVVAIRGGSQPDLEITAGGSGISNAGDFEHFIHTTKTGDFDIQVETARFDRSPQTGGYGNAGLQVRESLYVPGLEFTAAGTRVRTVMNLTDAEGNLGRAALTLWRDTPQTGLLGNSSVVPESTADSHGVVGRYGRLLAKDASGTPIAGGTPTASRWLRLKRTGNEFTSFWSYDGTTWTESPNSRHTLSLPSTVLVGFAVATDAPGITHGTENRPWHYSVLEIRELGDITSSSSPVLTISRGSSASITVNWIGGGTLQQSDTVAGPWTTVSGANGTYTTTAGGTKKYFRVLMF